MTLSVAIVIGSFLFIMWGPFIVYSVRRGNLPLLKILCLVKRDLSHVHELRGPSDYVNQDPPEYTFRSWEWRRIDLLKASILQERTKVTKWLLEKGLDPNSKDFQGCTPLHFAAAGGDYESIQLLLDHGANIQERSRSGRSVISYAVWNYELFRYLVKIVPNFDPLMRDNYGDTLLHSACICHVDEPRTIYYLVSMGVDPNSRTKEGKTPLYFATECRHPKQVVALLESGANPDLLDNEEDILQKESNTRERVTKKEMLDLINKSKDIQKR
ncbi:MAG TPA: ankyrin repeat domain-containing protein [Candidatus Sumerlaeota bacterium]|nr:ankyrin repeat domain-containing protein [Candidatus Sumerlaeota bacterium]